MNTSVTVVVVGLPDRTETITAASNCYGNSAQCLEIRAVLIATENHSLLIGFALVFTSLPAWSMIGFPSLSLFVFRCYRS